MYAQRQTIIPCTMVGGASQVGIVVLLLAGLGIWHCMILFWSSIGRFANCERFLAGQMHVFRPRTDLARVLLALAPLIGAALIAISRCEDYRHDVYDVTIGSTLGMFVAHFSYRRYYPGLKSSHCDRPFPSRAESASIKGFGKLGDEEERIQTAGTFIVDDAEDDAEHVPLRSTNGNGSRMVGSSSNSQA